MDVGAWLRKLGLEQYEQQFHDNDVDADLLARLTAEDLREIGVASIGHRRRLIDAIASLRAMTSSPSSAPPEASAAVPDPEAHVEAERRQLTVIFVDLVGSTALARRLDPEDLRTTIRVYHDACASIVARFGGIVAKYLGDGVLAYFGWPRTREDEAQRAVRAGLAIVETVSGLTSVAPLAARAGIATGLVVVGDLLGQGAAREEAVVGATPNLAARLQQLAESSTVVVGERTHRLLDGLFDVEDLGLRSVRGFADPVQVWRVLGQRSVVSRFEARAVGITPLAGREQEVALLLDRWQQACDGEGQVVLLCGEPGIGKSRIAHALCQHLEGQSHLRLQYQCSPHYADTALHPVIDHLERTDGLWQVDAPVDKLDKLEGLLALGTDRVSEAAPLIAQLLSIPVDGRYPPLSAVSQRQREATIDALVAQVTGRARKQPVLAVFEDVHWADPTTLELLDRLIMQIQSERVSLLLTFRPEFSPLWREWPHSTLISLNRLPRRKSVALASAVAGKQPLPEEVLQQIVARADGVPLFIEELTKAVLEAADDRTARDGDRHPSAESSHRPTIPETLQDSLMARLDRLGRAKELAQIGATIGREFGYELLTAVSSCAESDLRKGLELLVASELVFVRGAPPTARATPSSTLWCRTSLMRAFSRAAASNSTRELLANLMRNGPKRHRSDPSCSPITLPRQMYLTRLLPMRSRQGGCPLLVRQQPRQ